MNSLTNYYKKSNVFYYHMTLLISQLLLSHLSTNKLQEVSKYLQSKNIQQSLLQSNNQSLLFSYLRNTSLITHLARPKRLNYKLSNQKTK